jgi:TonB family protein
MTRWDMRTTHAGPVPKHRELFQCLSDGEMPKRALGASIGLHGILLMLLILVPVLLPQTLHLNYRTLMLAPPPEPPRDVQPPEVKLPPIRAPRPKPVEPEPIVEKLPAPAPIVPPEPQPRILKPVPKPTAPAVATSVAPSLANVKPLSIPAPPPPPIVTNTFSNITSPTLPVAPTKNVETSGFGDPSSTASRTSSKAETVSVAGFGDSAGGSRQGARSGKSGTVGSVSGFDGASSGGTRVGGNPGTVASAGFATPAEAPKTPQTPQKSAEPGNEKPVEIVSKPRPDYTDEARKMRIEGEVLLRVLFTSSGAARVLDVISGLGHGLDENAIRAAEQIRFKPAQRAGQPADSTAIVHIVFQLAF